MHELIEKYFKRNITDTERDELFLLIETDARIKKEFITAQNLYAISSLLPSEDDSIKSLCKLKEFKQKRNRKQLFRSIKHIIGYAAAISCAVMVTWMLTKDKGLSVENEMIVSYEEFITPPGQRAMVKLYDGTTVWLNARSSLRYPNTFINGERRVELDGEAYFNVAHNEDAPFIVSTEKLDIKALGTEFNVYAYKGRHEFNTSLINGSIKVYTKENEHNAMFIIPNECAELIDNKLVKSNMEGRDFLLWKEGIYSFDDVVFTEIIRKLELYYDVTINVTNKRLAEYKFTGKFRQRDGVESVLRTLQKIYKFSFTKDDEKNIITI